MTSEHIFETLHDDLRYYNDYLQGISNEILDSGISKYPIFVAHQTKGIGIGKQVLMHESLSTKWSINVSALEEFVHKSIVTTEKLADFKRTYKDPELHLCVFAMLPDGSNSFAFLPYIQDPEII